MTSKAWMGISGVCQYFGHSPGILLVTAMELLYILVQCLRNRYSNTCLDGVTKGRKSLPAATISTFPLKSEEGKCRETSKPTSDVWL